MQSDTWSAEAWSLENLDLVKNASIGHLSVRSVSHVKLHLVEILVVNLAGNIGIA